MFFRHRLVSLLCELFIVTQPPPGRVVAGKRSVNVFLCAYTHCPARFRRRARAPPAFCVFVPPPHTLGPSAVCRLNHRRFPLCVFRWTTALPRPHARVRGGVVRAAAKVRWRPRRLSSPVGRLRRPPFPSSPAARDSSSRSRRSDSASRPRQSPRRRRRHSAAPTPRHRQHTQGLQQAQRPPRAARHRQRRRTRWARTRKEEEEEEEGEGPRPPRGLEEERQRTRRPSPSAGPTSLARP